MHITYTLMFISSVQSLSRVRFFSTPWITARQASLSITNSRSSLRLMSIGSVMPSNHLILCRPLLLLPSIPPSIRVFSNESSLLMRWPKYWSGLPFSTPRFFPTQGLHLCLPHLLHWQASFYHCATWKAPVVLGCCCSVIQSCLTLQPHGLQHTRLPCPSLLPEFVQTHVHWVSDAIQPSHPLSAPSPLALNLSQHWGLFQ